MAIKTKREYMFSRLHETSFTRKTLELLQREFTQAGQTDGGYVALKWAAEDREEWRHRERMSKTRCTAEDCWWRWLDGHPHWQTPSVIILELTTNRTAVKSLHYLSASIFAMIQFRETTEDASQATDNQQCQSSEWRHRKTQLILLTSRWES